MKENYELLLSQLANVLYRRMYKDNYLSAKESGVTVVNVVVSNTNKRALALALMEKEKQTSMRDFCVITNNLPVTSADSETNKKALAIASKTVLGNVR